MTKVNKLAFFIQFLSVFVFFISLSPSIKAQGTAEQFLNNGLKNAQLGAYVDAIRDFDMAIQVNSQMEEAYYYRGEAYYKYGDYKKALEDFDKAIQLAPNNSMNYYQRGLVLNALGNYSLAIQDFDKALSISPNSEHIYLGRAESHWAMGSNSAAAVDCDRALSKHPNMPEAHALKGLIAASRGNITTAVSNLEKSIQIAPQEAIYIAYLADAYFQNEEYSKAEQKYLQALKINHRLVEANYGISRVYLLKKDFDNSRKYTNIALAENDRFFPSYLVRAVLYFNDNLTTQAEKDFNTYINQANTGKDYLLPASFVSEFINDKIFLEDAKVWAKKASELLGNYESYYTYGKVLFQLSEKQEAQTAIENSIKIAQSNGQSTLKAENLLKQIRNDANLDKTPPVIEITSPTSLNRGFVVVDESEMIEIEGKVFDESGVVKVLVNGNPASLDATGYFKGKTALSTGQNVIILKATDRHGNTARREVMLEVQSTVSNPSNTNDDLKSVMGRQRALLFASNDYEHWGDLVNPIPDTKAIASDLEEIYGFQVEVVENPTKEEVMLTLRSYAKKTYAENDELLIFFAGHGHFDELVKQGYLVTTDSRLNDETQGTYISHSDLRYIIDNIECEHILLIMDVCFGGTFDPVVARRGEEDAIQNRRDYISRKLRYRTRRYITSGGKEYVPDGTPGEHSPFARKLLEALRSEGGNDGILNIEDINYYIQSVYPKPLSGEFGNNEPGSDFIFIAH